MGNKCKCSTLTDGCDVCAPKNDPYHPGYAEQPKGPYFLQDLESGGLGIGGPGRDANEYSGLSADQASVLVRHLNEGYKAGLAEGRASRDGLREALKSIAEWDFDMNLLSRGIPNAMMFAEQALAADEKGKP